MTRRILSLALALLIAAIAVAACARSTPATASDPPPPAQDVADDAPTGPEQAAAQPTEDEQQEQTPTPLVLIDDLGREVTIPDNVGRIISLTPSVTESLFAIGAGDLVSGRSSFDNFPPEVIQLPEVGGMVADDISVETIVSLEPDLVIAGTDLQAPLVDAFEAVNIPIYFSMPQSLDDIYQTLTVFGQITGHEGGAQAVVVDMQARIAVVQDTLAQVSADQRPSVFYEIWDEPLITAGPATFIGQMLVVAGGVDIFADLDEPWAIVSSEAIIERQPQVIMGPQTHAQALSLDAVAARPGWDAIPAVQNGMIFFLDDDIVSRNGPRAVDAIELIAASLYPELFGE